MIRINQPPVNRIKEFPREGQSPASASLVPNSNSPLRLIVVTSISIFVSEALIMVVLSAFPSLRGWEAVLLDASLILFCSLPVLYLWLYRPLIQSISVRLQAETVLRESEEKFRTLVESINAIPWRFDLKNNRFTFVGKQAEMILGVAPESWTDVESWSSRIHADDRDEAIEFCTTSTKRGEDHDFEYRYVTADGEIVWLRDIVSLRKDENGVPVELLGYMVDVTEKRLAEERLKESEEKYKSIVESSQDVIMLTKPSGQISYLSPACKQVLGYDAEELVGKQPWIVHPDDLERVRQTFSVSLRGESGSNYEYRVITKANETKWVSHSWSPILDDGKLKLIVSVVSDITERKRAEKALQESESRLLDSQRIARLGHYVFDSKTGHWTNSAELDKIFGIDGEFSRNMAGWLYIIHPDFREMMSAYLQEHVLSQHRKFDKEYKIIDMTTGQEKWVHGLGDLRFNEANELVEMFGTIQDITERKQYEEELRRYECIVSSSSDMLALLDENFLFLAANDRYAKALGKTLGELVGLSASQVFGSKYFETVIRPNAQKCMWGREVNFQNWFDFPTLGKRYMEIIYYPYCGSDNQIKGFVVNGRDTTDRKQAEEANALLSRAIEQVDETIVITDAEGAIQYVNPAFERVTGHTAKEAIGQSPSILKSGRHDDTFYESMWETLSSGHQWQGEIINKKKDGNLFTEHAVISPVFDSQGEIVNYVAAKNDITETKRLKELESRAQRLEMAGTIAGQVAHDFNNLLAPIMAYPDIIREELPGDHIAGKYLDDIESAAKKIVEINQDLLTMGRRGHYNQEVLDLNRVVLQAVKEMEARSGTITVELDLCDDLMKIKGGNAQIHRMLNNLLVNAQDAMQDTGKVTIRTENYCADDSSVAFGHVPKGDYVKLTVTDRGCGIPDDIVENVLDPFFSTKTTDKKRGSGLGLSVVDAVIKDHDGYLDLKSEIGKGSSFYVYLPPTREDAGEDDASHSTGGTETILVVDDDKTLREVSSLLLTKLGYKVTCVDCGEKAIKFLRENPQDLVILDMIMPGGIDGAETYRRILEICPQHKAIVMSGYSESRRVLEAQKLGAGAFLSKPVTKSAIATAVRTELDRAGESVCNPS